MNSYDILGWSFIEEAVIRDRGYDEERDLAAILKSYFIRRGFVDSLMALNDELVELEGNNNVRKYCVKKKKANGGMPMKKDESPMWNNERSDDNSVNTVVESMKKRKQIQLLCLNEQYEEAAELLPHGSVFKVKLLAMEAMKIARSNQSAALFFLCVKVSPLVVETTDATMAHHIFVNSLAAVSSGVKAAELSIPTPRTIAREVNESLLEKSESNALDILLSWSDWQVLVRKIREGEQKKVNFPFTMKVDKV
ncbi:uncharacterized protein TM35_000281260 [Trypanosoma theileri]|uniref:LisH domain-containing protein n=1 Tax=Trypanosoma theileri TaxID=67003 RepID=A0A1X0NQK9_9TRYP|nr:uncharacterized protein TM35_000281260 [Trypanosoma theileri]ORC86410.1 hypothetical protein TM35_000281260 [Trypanosoma theileri]